MSAQVSNFMVINEESYEIKEKECKMDDFELKPLGLKANRGSFSFGCWSGYNWGYEIIDGILYRNYLTIYDSKAGDIAINGIYPNGGGSGMTGSQMISTSFGGCVSYQGLKIPTNATGKIIVANEFDFNYYKHCGEQTLKGYNKVLELVFKDGLLIDTNDVSDIVAQYRVYDDKKWEKFRKLNHNDKDWNKKWNEIYYAKEDFDLDTWWLRTNNWDEYYNKIRKEENKQKEHEEWIASLSEEELEKYKIENEKRDEDLKKAFEKFWEGDY